MKPSGPAPSGRLPVAGIRSTGGELRAAMWRQQWKDRGPQIRRSVAVAGGLGALGMGFFANSYPVIQLPAFLLVAFLGVGVISWLLHGALGLRPVRPARTVPVLYPPNALADNLCDVMQGVLDILATKSDREVRRLALRAKLPDAALAFSAFFGRSLYRVRGVEIAGGPFDDLTLFTHAAIRFAESVSGREAVSEEVVSLLGEDLLAKFRRVMNAQNVFTNMIDYDDTIIDPVTLPRPRIGEGGEGRSVLAKSESLLGLKALPVFDRIKALDSELGRLRSSLTPEDAGEWARVADQHLPGLEATFLHAYQALGCKDQVVDSFARALALIADSLDRILARVKSEIADDFRTNTRFIEARHGDPLSPASAGHVAAR